MKTLILVPHQDDEINLTGNILSRLVKFSDVYVIYSSLDKNNQKGKIRKDEALKALKLYEISSEKVHFMEYPDTSNNVGTHFFLNLQERRRFISELCGLIQKICPDIIFGTDFDWHSDHRMLSIAVEEAIKILVEENITFHPVLLKGFCYEMGYYAISDYSFHGLKPCRMIEEDLSNPSYEWKKRIAIECISYKDDYIWNRRAFKALRCHKSQYAVLQASSIINRDNVFWERRTDNLALFAKVSASSGNSRVLNDFKILDTDDLFTMNPREIDYSKSVWKPAEEDKCPRIIFQFCKEYSIEKIVLHSGIDLKKKQCIEFEIYVNGNFSKIIKIELMPQGKETEIYFSSKQVKTIEIRFMSRVELSEIEFFENEESLIKNVMNNILYTTDAKINENRHNYFYELINEVGWKGIQVYYKILRRLKIYH